ncbi:40S ribosomal protein S15a-5 [Prunus yedoensis var. nudiflora]|uniref:40S ribosomal protein S15a-5 n=2 Tax=Prunus TaxID=3754 RepID=A0A314XYS9_PRUYE|nr:40S ribosomal protein S15a-5 [Prunus yedoensis var. nudiflora]
MEERSLVVPPRRGGQRRQEEGICCHYKKNIKSWVPPSPNTTLKKVQHSSLAHYQLSPGSPPDPKTPTVSLAPTVADYPVRQRHPIFGPCFWLWKGQKDFSKRRMGRMILNNALRTIVNAERRGKATVELQPISTVMSSFLKIMKNRGYIKDFQVFDPHRVGKITVQLQGRVNDCRALTYRQDVKARDIEEYKMQKLPTRQWGYVVITTPEGVLDHEEAVKRNVGGQVLGYFH